MSTPQRIDRDGLARTGLGHGHAYRRPGTASPTSRTTSRRSVEYLDALLGGFAEGGYVVGPEGRIVAWNAGAERILGYAARDIVGKRCDDLFSPGIAADSARCDHSCPVIARTNTHDPVASFETPARTKSGHTRWLSV